MTVPNIFATQSGPIPLVQLDENFAAFQQTGTGVGANLISDKNGVTGTVARTQHSKNTDVINAKDFGVIANGVVDDTVALVAAWDYLVGSGGGTLELPRGTMICNNAIFNVADHSPVSIRGAGMYASRFMKTANDANPCMTFTAATIKTSLMDLADFCVLNEIGIAYSGTCIKIVLASRFTLTRLAFQYGAKGIDIVGALSFSAFGCYFLSNKNGFVSTKSATGPTYCNQIQFDGCLFALSGSTATGAGYGMDIGDCGAISVSNCDFEQNGTAGNSSTGDVIVRSTCGAELGTAQVIWRYNWHEVNTGKGFTVETNSRLRLYVEDSMFSSQTGSTYDLNVGDIRLVSVSRTYAGGGLSFDACSYERLDSVEMTFRATTSINKMWTNVKATTPATDVLFLADGPVGYAEVFATGQVVTGADPIIINSVTLCKSNVTMTNGAGVATGTLTNAPSAGNPTKWIIFDDNGTLRKIPAW